MKNIKKSRLSHGEIIREYQKMGLISNKKKGWFNVTLADPIDHGLAAQGIKSRSKGYKRIDVITHGKRPLGFQEERAVRRDYLIESLPERKEEKIKPFKLQPTEEEILQKRKERWQKIYPDYKGEWMEGEPMLLGRQIEKKKSEADRIMEKRLRQKEEDKNK